MTRAITVSAPGKLILMGEHAAVYGRPALVAAVDLRTRVRIEDRPQPGVELDLKTLGHREETDWAAIHAYTRSRARAWSRYAENPMRESFDELVDHDPARVVKLALGEAALALEGEPPAGLRLVVDSSLPVGSGFGSSASVAVAVAGGLLELVGELEPGFDRLARITLAVERRQHGTPSGVDHSTVLRGGILRLRPLAGETPHIVSLAASARVLAALHVFDTGAPVETTGEVVAAVRARRQDDRAGFDAILARMEAATLAMEDALAAAAEVGAMVLAVRDFERQLEAIGVVPPAVSAAIRRLEAVGAAAKISGSGTLSEGGAGALIVCGSPDRSDLAAMVPGFRSLGATIGAPGFRVEGDP